MHEAGIIHGDLNMSNIMFDGNEVFITDFDNSTYGKYSMNLKEASNLALYFIKKYGIMPKLDVFLFNYATYYISNDCITSNGIPFSIRNNDCGIFADKDQIKM